jgi:hypothetical protein
MVAAHGASLSAAGATYQAQAEAQAFTYKAAVAKMNQDLANKQSDYATAIGEVKAQQSGMQTRAQIGATRTAYAAGNIALGMGSAGQVQESEAALGAWEEATIRNDAARQSYGYKIEGLNYQAESDLEKLASANALTEGAIKAKGYGLQAAGDVISGVGSLLGSVGNVSKLAASFAKSGIYGGSSGGSDDSGTGLLLNKTGGLY